MKKVVILVILVSFALCAISLYAQNLKSKSPQVTVQPTNQAVKQVTEKSFSGYLSDVMCGNAGRDTANNDLTKYPSKHAVVCMKSPKCSISGYGIFFKNPKGLYEFHRFDTNGNNIAKGSILKNTTKKNDVSIVVMGTLGKDGVLRVSSIKESILTKQAQPVKREVTKSKPTVTGK